MRRRCNAITARGTAPGKKVCGKGSLKGFARVEWGLGLTTNAFGFNDRDYPLERRPGTCRILVLGDSFSWAEGQRGNYTAILEEMLARRRSRLAAFLRWEWRYFSKVPEPEMTGPQSRVSRYSLTDEQYMSYGYGRMQFARRGFGSLYDEPVAYIMSALEEMRALLPEFAEAHQRGDRLYHPCDTHWNAAGNQLAAETLFGPVLETCKSRFE